MSQPNRPRKGAPQVQKQNPALGGIAALIVVALFIVLGLMLSQRAASTSAVAPTQIAFTAISPMPATPGLAPTEGPTIVVPTSPATAVAAGAPTAAANGDVAARVNKYKQAPPMAIDPAKSYTATITTPRGDIVIKLRPDLAPQTVNSFVFLAREGYFNGVTWHRVIKGFVAQGGDPTGTGMGGPGYTIPGEFTDKVLFDKPGIVAMARPGNDLNGNGSQFFITLAPTQNLDKQYTIFGEVTKGLDIVNGIPERDPSSAATPGEQLVKVTITEG